MIKLIKDQHHKDIQKKKNESRISLKNESVGYVYIKSGYKNHFL